MNGASQSTFNNSWTYLSKQRVKEHLHQLLSATSKFKTGGSETNSSNGSNNFSAPLRRLKLSHPDVVTLLAGMTCWPTISTDVSIPAFGAWFFALALLEAEATKVSVASRGGTKELIWWSLAACGAAVCCAKMFCSHSSFSCELSKRNYSFFASLRNSSSKCRRSWSVKGHRIDEIYSKYDRNSWKD